MAASETTRESSVAQVFRRALSAASPDAVVQLLPVLARVSAISSAELVALPAAFWRIGGAQALLCISGQLASDASPGPAFVSALAVAACIVTHSDDSVAALSDQALEIVGALKVEGRGCSICFSQSL